MEIIRVKNVEMKRGAFEEGNFGCLYVIASHVSNSRTKFFT